MRLSELATVSNFECLKPPYVGVTAEKVNTEGNGWWRKRGERSSIIRTGRRRRRWFWWGVVGWSPPATAADRTLAKRSTREPIGTHAVVAALWVEGAEATAGGEAKGGGFQPKGSEEPSRMRREPEPEPLTLPL